MAASIGILALVSLIGSGTAAATDAPIDQVQHSIDRVLAILADPALKTPAKAMQREAALRHVIEARFDFDEMARQALGPHWRERTPQEKRQFTDLFRELLERSYIIRIESYAGERVRYLGESVSGDDGIVRTGIVTTRGSEIPMDYRLVRRGDRWLVYDVLIERVSLVDNYRTQFRDIMASSSYQGLVSRIEAKLSELRMAAPSRRSGERMATPRGGG